MLTVLDIGVRGGPDPRWYPLADSVQVIGVDADANECQRLATERFPVPFRAIPAALGADDGVAATLYLTRQRACSSLLEPNQQFLAQFPYGAAFTVEQRIPITLTTLDTFCAREGITPHALKLDTQGTELDILRGGRQALGTVVLIELEVEFNPLYVGQPLFGDVDAFLRSEGFALLGLRRTAWRRTFAGASGGTVVHGDALFYREQLSDAGRTQLAAALPAYGQDDFARTLGGQPADRRTLAQRLVGTVLAQLGSHKAMRAWLDDCRADGAQDWHDPYFF